jgi:hypothetical protein
MTTKREAEIIEQIVSSMTENEYWGLVGWLSNACEGPLWKCLRRPRRRVEDSAAAEASSP